MFRASAACRNLCAREVQEMEDEELPAKAS